MQIIHNPLAVIAAYWIYSAAISSMPEPMPNGAPGYKWLYAFLHTLAGNIDKLAASKGIK